MPVSEAEKEFAPVQTNGSLEPKPKASWMDAIDLLVVRRRLILYLTLAGLALTLIPTYFIPKYPSEVQIMPPDGPPSGLAALALPSMSKSPGLAGLAGELLGGGKNSTAVFIKVLGSRTVQDYLVDRFDLRTHYHKRYWEDAREKLKNRTTITDDKKSGIISLTFEDRDPIFAAAVSAAYVEELDRVVTKVATSSARREREFIEQRLAEEKNQLDVSQRQFSAFASSNMALDVPQQTRVTVESAARLEGELIARKSELEGLTQIYARDNFRVKSAQARVAELEKALNKLNSGPDKTGGAQDPTNPYPSVRSLPQLGVTWTDLYRTIKIHETVFELLTQQFEMAKIQEAKEIPTVKILDAATTPEKRYPRPWIVTLVGGVLSLLLSCAGVVLYNGWENLGPEDSRRVLVARVRRGFTNPRSFVIPRSSRESASQERDRANDYSERRL